MNEVIKILGQDFPVETIQWNEFSGQTYARSDSGLCTIAVADCIPETHKHETILHEVLHVISDRLGLGFDERQVTALSSGLYCVLKENGIEVKFNRKEEAHE